MALLIYILQLVFDVVIKIVFPLANYKELAALKERN